MIGRPERGPGDQPMAESQLSELQNARVLLEEARGLSRNLAYHRRARLEARIGEALEEVDQRVRELRSDRGYGGLALAADRSRVVEREGRGPDRGARAPRSAGQEGSCRSAVSRIAASYSSTRSW